MNISFIGTGLYGIALATNALENNCKIKMWSENEELIKNYKKNNSFLPVIDLKGNKNLTISNDLKDVIKDADLIILSTAAKYVREMCLELKDIYNKEVPICIASKGIENDTCAFLSDVVISILNTRNIAVISGPSFAADLLKKEPIALSLAALNTKTYNIVYSLLSNSHLKLRKSKDIRAIELCGSIKNVIAIAAGILDGLGYQESTRAFLITESLHDIKELLKKLHCNHKAILSFAGMGDLILTCSSVKSRNYRFGIVLGKKSTKKEIEEYLKNNTTEGYYTLLSIRKLTKNKNIDMPIINIIYDIVINNKNPEILSEFLIKKE